MRLLNIQGNLLWQSNSFQSIVSLNNFSKGIYILQIENETGLNYVTKVLR